METNLKVPVLKYGINAVCINIFGVIFSGLVFPVLTLIYCPQPPWIVSNISDSNFLKTFNNT